MGNDSGHDLFPEAKRILREAKKASEEYHLAKSRGDTEKAIRSSDRKVELACKATLIAPKCIVWSRDWYTVDCISIATTSKNGPGVHLPISELEHHISKNGFKRAEKNILFSRLKRAIAEPAPPKRKSSKRGKRKGPAKV